MHLVNPHVRPSVRVVLNGIHEFDRFAVGKREDDVSVITDVFDDRLS
ncbi:MAG TPA: hypothetical protein VIH06_17165 [Ilumatobacteraceae bacterium]